MAREYMVLCVILSTHQAPFTILFHLILVYMYGWIITSNCLCGYNYISTFYPKLYGCFVKSVDSVLMYVWLLTRCMQVAWRLTEIAQKLNATLGVGSKLLLNKLLDDNFLCCKADNMYWLHINTKTLHLDLYTCSFYIYILIVYWKNYHD